MKKKWFLIIGASALFLVLSKRGIAFAAAVSSAKLNTNEFVEDSETEAVVIDATTDLQSVGARGNHEDELPRSPLGGKTRHGKQYLSYLPLYPETYLLPEETQNENYVGLLPDSVVDSSCVTNQGKRGSCEQFEKCFPLFNLPDNLYGNETNYSNLQEELYQISVDKKCSSVVHAGTSKFSHVCCDLPLKNEVKPVAQFYDSRSMDEELNSNSSSIPKYTKIVNTWATCGEKQFETKIIGGQDAIPHEYPWMVSLWGKSGKHICGASLLDNSYVLTAAHCIARYTSQDVGKIRLQIGDHNIHSTSDGHHEVRSVSRIIKHKRFSLQTFVNDIALLKLDRPVPYTDRIRPICLPSGARRIDDDENLVVAGWGQTSYKGQSSSVLRKVVVPGVDSDTCGTVYNSISPVGITDDMVCAGGVGIDSCIGDSGGPLLQVVNNRYEQVGIVSFGRECGIYYGVYTKVHSFLKWIQINRNKY